MPREERGTGRARLGGCSDLHTCLHGGFNPQITRHLKQVHRAPDSLWAEGNRGSLGGAYPQGGPGPVGQHRPLFLPGGPRRELLSTAADTPAFLLSTLNRNPR